MTQAPTLTPRGAREQQTFRVLLHAMSRPGSIGEIAAQAEGLSPAVAVAEALVDHEVTFAALPERPDMIDAVLRLTGSRVSALEAADYVFCDMDSLAEALQRAKDGTLEYPDRSATLVCEVEDIHDPRPGDPVLTGPGINGSTRVHLHGLTAEARAAFTDRNALPPRGIDVVFVAKDGQVCCLSRYTRLQVED